MFGNIAVSNQLVACTADAQNLSSILSVDVVFLNVINTTIVQDKSERCTEDKQTAVAKKRGRNKA